jgi:hypothetical protein
MQIKDYTIWVLAGITAVFVLMLGLDIISRKPRSKFLVALSVCLLGISTMIGLDASNVFPQDNPKAEKQDNKQDEIKNRVEDVKKTKEFKKLQKIYHKLLKLQNTNKPLTGKLERWRLETPRERPKSGRFSLISKQDTLQKNKKK